MYLYVIRHGQTDWNIQKKLLSVTDIPLNDTGIEQCNEAEKLVKNLNYDLVICSPMTRTKQTAEIVNSKNIDIMYDDRLIERDSRSLEGIDVDTFDYQKFWTYGKEQIEDEETIEECKARVYELLDEIKEKYKDKNILLVTHGGVARAVYFYFNELPKDGMLQEFGSSNCGITEYDM